LLRSRRYHPHEFGNVCLVGAALTFNYPVWLQLDDVATPAAARADISGFVARLEPRAILDEVQHMPELYVVLKPNVDANRNSVRFILTGSSNILLAPRLSDSLAGRLEILRLYPLAQIEMEHSRRKPDYPAR
jgi:predicted AAA+ superfamily ATPase